MTTSKDAKTPSLRALPAAPDAARREEASFTNHLEQGAAQTAPEDLNTWLMRLETAASHAEAVACLNQINALAPGDPLAVQKTYQVIQALLKDNPHLIYQDETGDRYIVRSGDQISLIVPKDRAFPEPRFTPRPALLYAAFRWLWLALFGLLPAGLGAMFFAPLAALSALGLNLQPLSRPNRILSLVIMLLSGSLWLFGLLLGVILLMHLI